MSFPLEYFPYAVGDTIYLRPPTWHYIGKITKICPEGNWVELYPVVHVLETYDAKTFYTKDIPTLMEEQIGRYEISPVPLQVNMKTWSATPYPFEVPTVDYEVPKS
jgi:hypothetical protein